MGHRGSGMNMLQSSDQRMKSIKENTILSFNAAARHPLDFIEFDVQVSLNLFLRRIIFFLFSFFLGGQWRQNGIRPSPVCLGTRVWSTHTCTLKTKSNKVAGQLSPIQIMGIVGRLFCCHGQALYPQSKKPCLLSLLFPRIQIYLINN